MSRDIRSFKLVTGEELIAEVMDTDADGSAYTCCAPFSIGADGENRLALVPFMPYTSAGEKFTLNRSCVMIETLPMEAVINHYSGIAAQLFGKLITPVSSIIGA
jgi:hypothetical protein